MASPTQSSRPGLLRSISAAAQLSPPKDSTQTNQRTNFTQAAAKRLHFPGTHRSDPLATTDANSSKHNSTEPAPAQFKKARTHRHHSPRGTARSTGHALAEFAKSTAHPVQRVAGSVVRRNDNDAHLSSQRPTRQAGVGAPVPEAPEDALPNQIASRRVTAADVAAEKERRARREVELREELGGLQQLATESTTELDETYYGILEKAGVVKELIAGLQDLVTRADEMKGGFEGEAKEMKEAFETQIEELRGFKNASARVEDMENRIRKSRDLAGKLSQRLESSRRALNDWEQKEKEWQAKTTKRIRISAASFWIVAALVVGLLVWRSWSRHISTGSKVIDVIDSGLNKLVELKDKTVDDDGRLRIFDEL